MGGGKEGGGKGRKGRPKASPKKRPPRDEDKEAYDNADRHRARYPNDPDNDRRIKMLENSLRDPGYKLQPTRTRGQSSRTSHPEERLHCGASTRPSHPDAPPCLSEQEYITYRPRIERYLRQQLGKAPGGPITLEDLTAQVFCRALYAHHRGNGASSSLSGWLYQIARSVILDHLRCKQREPIFDPLDNALAIPAPDHVENQVLHALESQHLLAHLPPQQEDLATRLLDGYSTDEMAYHYQIDNLALRQRIVRLRRRMRQRFRP